MTITLPKIFNIHGHKVRIHVAKSKYRVHSLPWFSSSISGENKIVKSHYMKYYPDSTFYLADNNRGFPRQGQKTVSIYLTDKDLNSSLQNEYMNSQDSTNKIPIGYKAADYCKSLHMSLPTIDCLCRIYQYKDFLKKKDEIGKDIDSLLLLSLNIWSSTVGDINHAWMIRSMGKVGYGRRHYPAAVIPIIEEILE